MKKILSILFFLMSIFAFSEDKIKVGIPSNLTDMYLYKNLETGKYEGMYPSILKDVIKTPVEYKINAENPEIILRISNTAKYKNYNFILTPLTYKVNVLVNKDRQIRNISDLKGLKIGYIEDSRGIKEFEDRFEGLVFEKVKVANRDMGFEKLYRNEIDAFVMQNYVEKNSFESQIRILAEVVYREQIGVRKDCTELYKKIKNGLPAKNREEQLKILRDSRVNYYKYILKDTPNYNFVKENYDEIRVKLPDDRYALPLYYKIGGIYKGMVPEILDEIEDILGIPVKIVSKDENIHGAVVEGKASKERYIISKSYYQGIIGIANRKYEAFNVELSDLDNSKIILLRDANFINYIPSRVKNVEIIPAENLKDGFDKLIKGEGDYFITFESFLDGGIINNFLDTKIKVAGKMHETFSISFGVNKNEEELGQVIRTIMRGFPTDQKSFNLEINNNILVAKNYKLMAQIIIPVVIAMIVLIILYIKAEKNRKRAEELSGAFVEIFESINQFDKEEAGDHAKRFALYSGFMAENLKLDKKKTEEIKKYSPLHDIGKAVIPKEILNKAGKLTQEEFEYVKEHVVIGYEIIKKLKLGLTAENIVQYHHEKWNGQGYPNGLSGENIPIEARIAALADIYDNLRQDKVYRKSMTHEEAVEVIKNESGISLDPKLAEIFIRENEKFRKIYAENNVKIYLADEILTALKK